MKNKSCCFLGHTSESILFNNESSKQFRIFKEHLYNEILRLITQNDVTHFITGMDQGFQLYGAGIIEELKKQWIQITLECAIPYEEQAAHWHEPMRNRYFDIIGHCDKETLLETHYSPDSLKKCNEYLVDNSDFVVALWDGVDSVTGNFVKYAEDNCKAVIVINPN